MSLETSAIFCLPLLFKTDPGSDVNYSPGFRWLLFQPAHFLGLLLSVSAAPKASAVHSPAGSSMALGTRDGSQPLAHYLHHVGSATAAAMLLCSFRVLEPSCQGVPEGTGIMVGEYRLS